MLSKDFRIDSKVLRRSAHGEECTFNVVGICNYDKETTVLCHSGASDDGKGFGKKGADLFAAFGCSECHAWFDNQANDEAERLFYFSRAMKRTWKRWVELGLIIIPSMK